MHFFYIKTNKILGYPVLRSNDNSRNDFFVSWLQISVVKHLRITLFCSYLYIEPSN